MKLKASLSLLGAAIVLGACGSAGSAGAPPPVSQASATKRLVKIYVANIGDNTISAYLGNGTQTTPLIKTGSGSGDYLFGLAVSPQGKIYALNFDSLLGSGTSATVTSFTPQGQPTKPTITVTEQGFTAPSGIAVDSNGKIYVLSSAHDGSSGIVKTYEPNGTQTTPTFNTGPDSDGIAIDANGKIYVANGKGPNGKFSVTTYDPNGSPTTPTITRDVHDPVALAVAADGTIYVASATNRGPDGTIAGYVTSYSSSGEGPLERIDTRAGAIGGLAVNARGDLYVPSSTATSSILRTYSSEGKRTDPTVHAGIYDPSGIVVH
ncbi:MAG TPA: hypothetical protein VGX91_04040 [Candidatus Cybelea sp.]|jgi:sugar lactone lactonase YvrE|nr:hypothetical protein [Candidatus Cybelea sp.]